MPPFFGARRALLSSVSTLSIISGIGATITSSVPLGISGTPHTAEVNKPYSYTPNVGGGSGVRSFTISGTLPAGISFNASTGTISGTPAAAGSTTHGITTTTTDGQTATLATRTLTVVPVGQVTLKGLFPNIQPTTTSAYSFSVAIGEAQGVRICRIFRRTLGSTLSITPSDGKVAISDDGTTAYIVTGSTATTALGRADYTIIETHPNATNSGLQTPWTVLVAPASNAVSVAAAGYRNAASNGQVNNASLGIVSGRSRFKARKRFKLGRSAYSNLRFAFSMWRIAPTSDQEEFVPSDAVTVPSMYVEIPGAPTPLVQVTYGGSPSRTFQPGIDFDFCDDLTPAMFGLTQFDDSTEVWFRWYYDLTGSQGAYTPGGTVFGGAQYMTYDPANEPAGSGAAPNDINAQGIMPQPTGWQQFAIFGPTICVGKQISGATTIPSVLVQGDSITDRLSDLSGDGESGGGYAARGCFAAGIPYFKHTLGGRAAYMWVNNNYKSKTLLLFHNAVLNALITNDLSNQSDKPTFLADYNAMNAQSRTAGITKIIGATGGPRTGAGYLASGANVLTNYRAVDLLNTFPYATGLPSGLGYEAGGAKDQSNAALLALVGQTNGLDAIVDLGALAANSNDPSKIAVRPFSSTLAAACAAGATTLSLVDAPAVGDTLILEPGSAISDGNGQSPVGANNYPLYVFAVSGAGPYTVSLTRTDTVQNANNVGVVPLVAHAAGAVVRATNSIDETHPTSPIHVAAAQVLTTILLGYYPAYSFTNAEAQSYVARYSSPPSDKFKKATDTLVGSLKSAGVFAKLDAMYLLAAPSAAGAVLNLKGTTFPLTLAGTTVPSFTVNKGLTGNGSTGYASTGINPSTASGLQFVQDSAHIGVYVLTDSANANYDIGSGNSRARIKSAANTGTVARIGTNVTTITATTGTASPPRNVLASRTGATASALYVNGASDTTSAGASNGLATGLDLFRDSGATYSDRQVAIASIGAGLAAAEALAKHNAEKAFLQTVGAVA